MLQQIGVYLLKVICISALLFLYYHIALRNKKFHYYNRFYLLMAVTISIVLPFVQFEWFTFFSGSEQTIHMYKIIYGGGENDVVVNGSSTINWQEIALYAAVAITIVSIVTLAFRIVRIQILKKKYPVQQFVEFDFINTDISSAPFSFFKNIFWRNDINLHDETGKQILQHEITHIQQKHTWDKIYMQTVLCFFWMNPFYYLIKKELYLIHEFIADENAVKHSDADAFAKMLLTAQFGKFNFLPAQSIFYSSIKRRLVMLTTSKKPHLSYVRRLLVLPLIASLVCLFAFTVKTRNSENKIAPIELSKPFVLVVDAGHGGKDLGAQANGLYEKDATLKIAQKIKDLSSQYGVDVVLTRSSDVYMDPKQKSEFANMQHADAFVSVHINSADADKIDNSGIEVVLTRKNEKLAEQNQVLGSSLLQSMSTDFKTASTLKTQKTGVWVIDNSNIPSALIECGYLTNASDVNILKDDAKIELMAKNILQGVAAYANNSFDKSKMYQLQNALKKDTSSPIVIEDGKGKTPLYIVDGKTISEADFKKIDANSIESVTVWKDKDAIAKYGDKGKNGVIDIVTKKSPVTIELKDVTVDAGKPIYVLNGKIISDVEMKKIAPDDIESINVLKDKSATDLYGDKGKNGVVIIKLKSQMSPPLIIRDSDGVANPSSAIGNKPVFDKVQQDPQFPGGATAWRTYLEKNLDASAPAKHNAPKGVYTVTVSFLVDDKGKVSDVKALNDPGYGTKIEAMRVIAQGPNWTPGLQNGQKVVCMQKQNISFMIN